MRHTSLTVSFITARTLPLFRGYLGGSLLWACSGLDRMLKSCNTLVIWKTFHGGVVYETDHLGYCVCRSWQFLFGGCAGPAGCSGGCYGRTRPVWIGFADVQGGSEFRVCRGLEECDEGGNGFIGTSRGDVEDDPPKDKKSGAHSKVIRRRWVGNDSGNASGGHLFTIQCFINACLLHIGTLLYIAQGTRLDIAFVTHYLALFSLNPDNTHWTALQQLITYVQSTQHYDLQIEPDNSPKALKIYVDASWMGLLNHRVSQGIALKSRAADQDCLVESTTTLSIIVVFIFIFSYFFHLSSHSSSHSNPKLTSHTLVAIGVLVFSPVSLTPLRPLGQRCEVPSWIYDNSVVWKMASRFVGTVDQIVPIMLSDNHAALKIATNSSSFCKGCFWVKYPWGKLGYHPVSIGNGFIFCASRDNGYSSIQRTADLVHLPYLILTFHLFSFLFIVIFWIFLLFFLLGLNNIFFWFLCSFIIFNHASHRLNIFYTQFFFQVFVFLFLAQEYMHVNTVKNNKLNYIPLIKPPTKPICQAGLRHMRGWVKQPGKLANHWCNPYCEISDEGGGLARGLFSVRTMSNHREVPAPDTVGLNPPKHDTVGLNPPKQSRRVTHPYSPCQSRAWIYAPSFRQLAEGGRERPSFAASATTSQGARSGIKQPFLGKILLGFSQLRLAYIAPATHFLADNTHSGAKCCELSQKVVASRHCPIMTRFFLGGGLAVIPLDCICSRINNTNGIGHTAANSSRRSHAHNKFNKNKRQRSSPPEFLISSLPSHIIRRLSVSLLHLPSHHLQSSNYLNPNKEPPCMSSLVALPLEPSLPKSRKHLTLFFLSPLAPFISILKAHPKTCSSNPLSFSLFWLWLTKPSKDNYSSGSGAVSPPPSGTAVSPTDKPAPTPGNPNANTTSTPSGSVTSPTSRNPAATNGGVPATGVAGGPGGPGGISRGPGGLPGGPGGLPGGPGGLPGGPGGLPGGPGGLPGGPGGIPGGFGGIPGGPGGVFPGGRGGFLPGGPGGVLPGGPGGIVGGCGAGAVGGCTGGIVPGGFGGPVGGFGGPVGGFGGPVGGFGGPGGIIGGGGMMSGSSRMISGSSQMTSGSSGMIGGASGMFGGGGGIVGGASGMMGGASGMLGGGGAE
ncbi:uncharacterized protein VP01_45g3 [Puccinia sorghi]|uniref:Uncharacterized protein n=1 Tax=Puccinia sorghi TaxID=27349 RepID=A0A0L6UPA2_9BASI|nr:uncharacterized protein VP01_45g3 [Puccinia sorghi]